MNQGKAGMNQQIALFYFAYRSIIDIPETIVEKYSINRSHHRILFFIGNLPGLNINELLEILEVSKQALHKPLRELKVRNYVVDLPDEEDKRSKKLFLSEQGYILLNDLMALQYKQFESVFGSLEPEAKTIWNNVMRGFAEGRPGLSYLDSF